MSYEEQEYARKMSSADMKIKAKILKVTIHRPWFKTGLFKNRAICMVKQKILIQYYYTYYNNTIRTRTIRSLLIFYIFIFRGTALWCRQDICRRRSLWLKWRPQKVPVATPCPSTPVPSCWPRTYHWNTAEWTPPPSITLSRPVPVPRLGLGTGPSRPRHP